MDVVSTPVAIMRLGRRVSAMIAILVAAGLEPAAADIVTITSAHDNTLFEDPTGSLSNGAGPVMFAGNNSQNLSRRALIRFDVAASIPSGVVVTDVLLTLNVSSVPNLIAHTFTLHRVLRDWGEGTSSATGGGGAAATSGDATWLHASWPDSSWTNAGGDFDSGVSGSQSVGDVGFYTWTGSPMAADVQAWLDHPASNLGWMLIGDETAATTARRFDSRENAQTANRPSLTITYSVQTGVPLSTERDGIALGPCTPNPGSGQMRFEFSMPTSGHVTLIVADVTGRLVATLTDRVHGPGRHQVEWDGGGLRRTTLAGGVYFYRLIVDGRSIATRRWVVLP